MRRRLRPGPVIELRIDALVIDALVIDGPYGGGGRDALEGGLRAALVEALLEGCPPEQRAVPGRDETVRLAYGEPGEARSAGSGARPTGPEARGRAAGRTIGRHLAAQAWPTAGRAGRPPYPRSPEGGAR